MLLSFYIPRMSCSIKSRIPTSNSTCRKPNQYQIQPDILAEGEFGTTRVACCGSDCSFIEKYQVRDLDETDGEDTTVRQEIDYQNLAAEYHLAPRIMEIHTCEKGSSYIMERLQGTLKEDLDQLSNQQIRHYQNMANKTIQYYLDQFAPHSGSRMIRDTITTLESMREAIEDLTTMYIMLAFQNDLYRSIERVFKKGLLKMETIWRRIPNPIGVIIPIEEEQYAIHSWIQEDNEEQQRDRIIRIALVVRLVKRLHRSPPFGPHLCHNDAHPGNIMRRGTDLMDITTDYVFIDFGLSEPLEQENRNIDQYTIQTWISRNRPHLAYLIPWMDRLFQVVTAYTTDEQLRDPTYYETVFNYDGKQKRKIRRSKRLTR